MAVFRVERNTGYTVMSNHHLRNKELTLKAKGLLSQMLSLPEDWDYTLAGLSHINREKIDAIREAVKELEKAGYIVRSRERDEKGRFGKQFIFDEYIKAGHLKTVIIAFVFVRREKLCEFAFAQIRKSYFAGCAFRKGAAVAFYSGAAFLDSLT